MLKNSAVRLASYALFSAALLAAPLAQAEVKVATVNVNKILNESKEATEKRKDFEAFASQSRKKLDAKKAELEALQKKVKEVGPEAAGKDAEKLQQQAREFERLVRDSDEELKKQFLKVNKTLTEKTVASIEAFAKKNKIDLVLDKSGKAPGVLIFGENSFDITNQIIAEINSK